MQKRVDLVATTVVFVALSLTASPSMASCLRWETVCHYDCIEYYPNGTDCKKTKKTCERVCAEDSFDVDRGGIDDANRGVKSKSVDPSSTKRSYPEPPITITGRLEKSTINQTETWIIVPREASGQKTGVVKAYEVDPGGTAIDSFENKIVDVSGKLSWTKNSGGGYLPSVSATSVRESK